MQTHLEPTPRRAPAVGAVAQTSYRTNACGKAILVGEHAVIYGVPAIAIPLIEHRLDVKFQSRPHDVTTKYKMVLGGKEMSSHVSEVVRDGFRVLGLDEHALEISGSSQLPIGAGLGSSATLCVAIIRGLCGIHAKDLNSEQVALHANQLEKRFHGNPSGLDTAVVAHECPIEFRRHAHPRVETLKIHASALGWRFVLIDSGERSATLAMIRHVEPFFAGVSGERHLAAFDKISALAGAAFARGCFESLISAMDEAGDLLRRAGAVTSGMEKIIAFCREHKLKGVKGTGAGGGGCLIGMLAQDAFQRQKQLEALRQQFGERRVFEFGLKGIL